jgi:hypothetical protein
MTTSLGKGMNELSTVMKKKIKKKPQAGAYAVRASRYWMSASVMGQSPR